MRIAGIVLDGFFENLLRRTDVPHIEQRDALVQARDLQLGIERGCLLKSLQGFFKELLVHVSRAQIIAAAGLGGIGRVFRSGGEQSDCRQTDTRDGSASGHAIWKLTTADACVHRVNQKTLCHPDPEQEQRVLRPAQDDKSYFVLMAALRTGSW